jgi:hypothetical protein
MSEIQRVTVTIEQPRSDFPGRVTFGYYKVVGDKVVMCGQNGKPIIDQLGIRYEQEIAGGNPHTIAALLTREIRRKVRGDSDMSRDLVYPPSGLA